MKKDLMLFRHEVIEMAINEARKEAIEECANVLYKKSFELLNSPPNYYVEKAIIELINDLK